jgi:hypothetical protein
MDHEDKIKLERALALSEENNELLHKIHRSMKLARWARVAYWIILLGASIGAFYYFQPYIDQILGTYGSLRGGIEGFFTSP